jgi:septal ring factor EnvC (AmiA/AmiB activator)
MSNEVKDIIVALIAGLCVALPTLYATNKSNKAHDAVVDEKMKNMSEQISHVDTKIDKYSSNQDEIKERLVIVEQSTKSAHHRLDDITAQLKITEHRK